MAPFVTAEQLRAALHIEDLVAAMREGHRRPVPLMERVLMRPDGPNSYLVWHAWQPGEVVVTKMGTIFPGNTEFPAVQALVVVFDGVTGAPVAVIDGTELTYWKTAAASLLGAQLLARADARTLLVVGAGGLAPHFIRGYRAMFALERVWLWNRTADKAAAVAAACGDVEVVTDVDDVVGRADIVTCLTATTEPLVKGARLAPGAHLDLVGGYTPEMREADDDAVRRAMVVVDAPMYNIDACGDLCQPLAAGVIDREDVVADLFTLCRGEHPGRTDPAQITLFKSGGGAHLDLMAAQHVLATIA